VLIKDWGFVVFKHVRTVNVENLFVIWFCSRSRIWKEYGVDRERRVDGEETTFLHLTSRSSIQPDYFRPITSYKSLSLLARITLVI
jgi:hypothetical protein